MRLRKHFWLPLALLLAGSVASYAEEAAKEELKVPSEEVIKSFVTTATATKDSKKSFAFNASFKPAVLPARSLEIYRAKGKIPFAISVELLQTMTTADGPVELSIFDGAVNIVVVDAAGQIVNKKKEDLSALCPS